MRRPIPIAPMASCFALTGFAIAIVSGLSSGDSALSILEGALFALVLCYAIAFVVAQGYALILREHLADFAEASPVPEFNRPVQDAPAEPEQANPLNASSSQEAEAA